MSSDRVWGSRIDERAWARLLHAERDHSTHTSVRDATDTVAQLFVLLKHSVFRYACALTRNAAEAEEIVQEAFLRLHRVSLRGEHIDNPKKWLFAVTRRLVIDGARRRHTRRLTLVVERVWQRLAETVSDNAPGSDRLLQDAEETRTFEQAMCELTEVQRQCLLLRWEGLVYREIAEVMDMTPQGAADAVQRAVTRLRGHLRA